LYDKVLTLTAKQTAKTTCLSKKNEDELRITLYSRNQYEGKSTNAAVM